MINQIRIFVLLISCCVGVVSCKKNKNQEIDLTDEVKLLSAPVEVKIDTITVRDFDISLNSNGILAAAEKVDLSFPTNSVITQLLVKEGDKVSKGQLLATQATTHLLAEQNKNNELLQKSYLQMQDILLGYGYELKDSLQIPKHLMEMTKTRSSFDEVKNQQIQTQKKIKESKLYAPFSGVVANVANRQGNMSGATNSVCTVINNSSLWVDFAVLEKELGQIIKGDRVLVYPLAFPDKKIIGTLQQINPVVNEYGLVKVKALIKNPNGLLLDGMSVKVEMLKSIKDVIAIPKSAVIDRQKKKVVFTYQNGKSHWNYVTLGKENKDSIIITEGLKKDDLIITEGNVHLAHDTEVQLRQ